MTEGDGGRAPYGVFTMDKLGACASLPHASLTGALGCPSVSQSAPALVLGIFSLDEDCFGLGKPGENRKEGGASELFMERKSGTPIGDTQYSASRTTHLGGGGFY
mgnify:CR=1 FL=1